MEFLDEYKYSAKLTNEVTLYMEQLNLISCSSLKNN